MEIRTIIKTKEEYDKIMQEILEISKGEVKANSPENDRLQLLALLIKDYDDKHTTFKKPTPIQAIKFRMEQGGLSVKDLVAIFGTTSRTYEVLNGKRKLTINMIRKLNDQLGIPAEVLIQSYK